MYIFQSFPDHIFEKSWNTEGGSKDTSPENFIENSYVLVTLHGPSGVVARVFWAHCYV